MYIRYKSSLFEVNETIFWFLVRLFSFYANIYCSHKDGQDPSSGEIPQVLLQNCQTIHCAWLVQQLATSFNWQINQCGLSEKFYVFSAPVYCPLNLNNHILSLQSIVEISGLLNINFKPVCCFQDGLILAGVRHLSVCLFVQNKDNILLSQIAGLNLLMYLTQIHSNSFTLFQICIFPHKQLFFSFKYLF